MSGVIQVKVRENWQSQPYVCAEWLNGCFPMRADVVSYDQLRFVRRIAEDVGAEVVITPDALEMLSNTPATDLDD